MKLQPELIPRSAFFSNLRDWLTKKEWGHIRKQVYAEHNHVCQICGDHGMNHGYPHRVEAHEVWTWLRYDLEPWRGLQVLKEIQSLCPLCHKVKHIGLQATISHSRFVECINHMIKINACTNNETMMVVLNSFERHTELSKMQWQPDLESINRHLIIYGVQPLEKNEHGNIIKRVAKVV